jgi:hypothetical protein
MVHIYLRYYLLEGKDCTVALHGLVSCSAHALPVDTTLFA